ncbi:cyclic AMP-dependent transcription factor ATF-6 alpha [Anopheles cruzii]|uniref:cyclic AMP-dependent transcription factor ATF-6 alpha n=1 Tax=Anopheles cruzii TaxID=68878 RepID=UPI0022EC17F6|nr:cyclic AMP-dependent transcription factor ATF-6 alpha [Anopheles cruzii]
MESSFDEMKVFDLSLENEYLGPEMYDPDRFVARFDEYGAGNLLLQPPEPTSCEMLNELLLQSFDSAQYGEFINPDDFLNDILKSEPDSCEGSSPSNRYTPSPSGSQQSIESGASSGGFDPVVPMHLESPPISPQGPISPTQATLLGPQEPFGQVNNVVEAKPPPTGRRIKVLPKNTSSSATKTITKKTIVLSAKDYKALMANMERQPSNNTILLKAKPIKNLQSVLPQGAWKTSTATPVPPKQSPTVPIGSGDKINSNRIAQDPSDSGSRTIPSILASGTSISEQTINEKTLKRHQRMIKNRQAAYQSRVKKKEYVTSLEDRIQELTNENAQLRLENASLLQRLTVRCACAASSLLIVQSSAKQVSPTVRKNAAFMLAMLVIVSINFCPIGNLLTNSNGGDFEPAEPYAPSHHHSRGLLWTNDSIDSLTNRTHVPAFNLNLTALDDLATVETLPVECPFYVNQTENVRLASELRRWIGVNGYKNLTDNKGTTGDMSIDTFANMFHLKDTIDSMYRQMKDISVQMKSYEKRHKLALAGKKRQLKLHRSDEADGADREVTPYRGNVHKAHDLDLYYPSASRKYAEFFEEIGRRDDTFYLVSFSEEHLLLPALAYNKTSRPRMSLMLPTVAGGESMANGSRRSDKITLMQIDCEVMNTSVIQIREKVIPGDLRPQAGTAAKGRNATSESAGRSNRNTADRSRLVRDLRSNSTSAHGGTNRKPNGQHQHGPTRPFFVERMNEHLKSEHHVN